MDMQARNPGKAGAKLRDRSFANRSRKAKTAILDEYCRNTSQNRKYVIGKLHSKPVPQPRERKKRRRVYDGPVRAARARLWEIFDCPCGQWLAPLLKSEPVAPAARPAPVKPGFCRRGRRRYT